ncbi:hypothetical protein KOI35_43935 [Actinoplanes bogorensis]|uniref:Uncharacterized protein n=1 Tax=Paractinoplanes bogorensis TaxID=1610840 RepID=A0ABS5Z6B0_9ACTN|nr:NAD(P)-binding domain-containing protein [Actinoplanes bogorensis]MBU2670474.1 hypothetical protein [Actinoplanes bogorensis]
MTTPTYPSRVAVLGQGAMGRALARTLQAARTWNRSPTGVDPADTVRNADVVLICVRDHEASRPLIAQIAPALTLGTPVINMSSGTSDDAVTSATAAADLGVSYVTGAIMVPTALIGTDQNLILYAGRPETINSAHPVLAALGGTVDVLGEDHAVPPALDMAMLDVFFAGMYAFLHSAALARSRGIEPSAYLPYAQGIISTLAAELPSLAHTYETHTYNRGEANLGMCLQFQNHILRTTNQAGVDPRLPQLLRDITAEQVARSGPTPDWDETAESLTTPTSN